MKASFRLLTVVLLLAAPLRAGAQLATSSVNPQDDTLAVRQMRTFLNGIRRSEKRPTVALVLSGGVFASWGYGSASGLGGTDAAPDSCIRGWQALNVRVIYDYEPNYNFKQGE